MGIKKKLDIFEKAVLEKAEKEYDGLVWLELGNQINRIRQRPAKYVYRSLGVDHTSIDLNGKNGALPFDLDEPLPEEYTNRFDVVTNYGTIEHINNQYQAFKTVHDSCKVGGLMIHGFPMKNTYAGHCRYYYPEIFADYLASYTAYEILDCTIIDFSVGRRKNHLLTVGFKKTGIYPFISEKEFAELPIHDTGDTSRTGDYTKK